MAFQRTVKLEMKRENEKDFSVKLWLSKVYNCHVYYLKCITEVINAPTI